MKKCMPSGPEYVYNNSGSFIAEIMSAVQAYKSLAVSEQSFFRLSET